jgi:hypothetical protein
MPKQRLLRAALPAACAFAALAAAPAAQAAQVTPTFVAGNPDCAALGYTTVAKFDPPNDGAQAGVTIDRVDEHYLNWTSTVAIDAVIVKGGPNANLYAYPLDTFGDAGLSAPDNGGQPYGLSHVEFCSDGKQEPRLPALLVEKVAAASPIPAGDVAHFTIKVTNTGNVDLTGYVFTDPRCDGGNATQTGGDTDSTFGVGEVRTYSCSVDTAVTDTADVVNTACAEGDDGATAMKECATATVTLTPRGTPGGTTPGGTAPGGTAPGGTTPDRGGILPETIASGRARLRGPSGCVKQAFHARVTGRSIASVAFYVDGRLVKRFAGERKSYSIKVNPRRYGLGRHRIVARVTFAPASGTQARTLPLTFRRCARGAVAPRFTG